MSNHADTQIEPLLSTVTGEPFQPVRLHYQVSDRKRLDKLFHKLDCMDWDESGKRWTWLFDAETKSLEFEISYNELVRERGPVVIGEFYFSKGHGLFDLRSTERAIHAVDFMQWHIPERVAKPTELDIANFLTPATGNVSLKPRDVFDRQPAERVRNPLAELSQGELQSMSIAERHVLVSEAVEWYQGRQLPRIENIALRVEEPVKPQLLAVFPLRQHLAIEHWRGNTSLTMDDLVHKMLNKTNAAGGFDDLMDDDDDEDWDDEDSEDNSELWEERNSRRLSWDFPDDIPTRDIFERIDPGKPEQLGEAVDELLGKLRRGEFRNWEGIMREEQQLRTMCSTHLVATYMIQRDGVDGVVRKNAEGFERFHEPWYESLRRVVPHLLTKPLRTASPDDKSKAEAWNKIAKELRCQVRHLSLPEGARCAFDVIDPELRHALTIQAAVSSLVGIDGTEDCTLDNPDQAFRIDDLLRSLARGTDSVTALNLTLNGLLEFAELPVSDEKFLRVELSRRLELSSDSEPLAPKLKVPSVALSSTLELKKKGLVHSEMEVRDLCVRSFWLSGTDDHEVTELALQAIDQFGLRAAFQEYEFFLDLPQSEGTLLKLLDHMDDCVECRETELGHSLVDVVLLGFSSSLIARNVERVTDVLQLYDPAVEHLVAALVHESRMNSNELWQWLKEWLEAHCKSHGSAPTERELMVASRLTDALGMDERLVAWVMNSLARTINDEDYSLHDELLATSIAGRLRLESAIPFLLSMLHTPDSGDTATEALCRIGSDDIVDVLDESYPDMCEVSRSYAIDVLQDIYTLRSQQALRRWLSIETSSIQRRAILAGLLHQFDTTAIEPANQELQVLHENFGPTLPLRREFVAACLLTDNLASELEAALEAVRLESPWHDGDEDFDNDEGDEDDDEDKELRGARLGRSMFQGSLIGGVGFDLGGVGLSAPAWGEHDWDDDDAASDHEDDLKHAAAGVVPPLPGSPNRLANRSAKVGRNDPCPCGSGKKYKKCCMDS
ncbi:MAG: SEC-C metal-binding domain-containing protein [Planctomycetota bacterium]|nr:SEC-C metal-binding domain-containing protein [Planctomycetota bacterium]